MFHSKAFYLNQPFLQLLLLFQTAMRKLANKAAMQKESATTTSKLEEE
jgi:hypothetical protein